MQKTTYASREFSRDVANAKKAALHAPVFITNRGKITHVLLSFAEYQRITGVRLSLADALSMPGLSDIEVEFPRSRALPQASQF
jgi:PHD/YefM family antitoxin component YafN of YafNO toxin-antitoxin module